MYKKVIFGREMEQDGIVCKRQIRAMDGKILFEDPNGREFVANYGVLDENGEFHAFCTATLACGQKCMNADSPACRYNRKYQHTAGYYVVV